MSPEEREITNMKNLIKKLTIALPLMLALFILCGARNSMAAVVVLDPGHGGFLTQGSGAIYAPYVEKALTFDVASKVKSELQAAGITVYMTRESDRDLSLSERAAYAKSVGANLMVSIHFNASGGHDKFGSEVWSSMYGNHHTVGAAVGSQILSQLTSLGFVSKGVKTKVGNSGDYYGIIRNGVGLGVPTIIVEHCFIDNPVDRAILESKGTGALAHADAAGIMAFFGSSTGQQLAAGALDVSPVNIASTPITAGGTVGAGAAASSYASSFTPAQWSWLLSQWAYTGRAVEIINSMPLDELKALVAKHEQGLI
jgi:N-acetylmuramoyl-L-alanine amidase